MPSEIVPEYMPHQQRVIDENNELLDKAQRLSGFFASEIYAKLSENEQNLLRLQYGTMIQYSEILKMRIATFKKGVV